MTNYDRYLAQASRLATTNHDRYLNCVARLEAMAAVKYLGCDPAKMGGALS